ncbi:Uncharacterized protein FWK35_00027513, partial [Aphis craccivora]
IDDRGEIFENFQQLDVKNELSKWAVEYAVPNNTPSGLLKILKRHNYFSNFPSDARTIHQINSNIPYSQSIQIKPVLPGVYYHFGLANGIKKYIDKFFSDKTINLVIGVDGLPLAKSSGSTFWPILGYIRQLNQTAFPIGIYWCHEKPEDSNIFMNDFTEEVSDLILNGITVECPVHGTSLLRRVCFPDLDCSKRSHQGFFKKNQEQYHTPGLSSNIVNIPGINVVQNFSIDYMHCVLLGVMKKMLIVWKGSGEIGRVGVNQQKLPSDRKPRSLDELCRWKAIELRKFLLYTGPVVFYSLVSKKIYRNFLTLNVAMTIFLSPNFNHLAPYALVLMENIKIHSDPDSFASENINGETNIIKIVNICYNTHLKKEVILGRKFEAVECFFQKPIKSSDIGVYKISNCSKKIEMWNICDIKVKYAVLPIDENISRKMWAIVHFLDDNSVESVPVHWIENDQCAWPKNSHNIHKLRSNCVKTNQFEFNFYCVRVLSNNIKMLIEAEEKVLTAQYTSDISDYGSSKKRKSKDGAVDTITLTPKTLPSYMSIKKSKISTGFNVNSKFKTKINNTKAKSSKVQLCRIQASSSDSDDNMSLSNSVDYDSDKDNEYIPEIKNKTKLSYDDINEKIITIDNLNIPKINNKSVKNNESHNLVENDNKKATCLNINKEVPSAISNNIVLPSSSVDSSNSITTDYNSWTREIDYFMTAWPVSNHKELNHFEIKLQANEKDFKNKVKLELLRTGGKSAKHMIQKIMKKMFSDCVLKDFTYFGLRNKYNFSTLLINKIIFDTIQQSKFQIMKDDEIISIIGKLLTTAKARIENKKQAKDVSNSLQIEEILL